MAHVVLGRGRMWVIRTTFQYYNYFHGVIGFLLILNSIKKNTNFSFSNQLPFVCLTKIHLLSVNSAHGFDQ